MCKRKFTCAAPPFKIPSRLPINCHSPTPYYLPSQVSTSNTVRFTILLPWPTMLEVLPTTLYSWHLYSSQAFIKFISLQVSTIQAPSSVLLKLCVHFIFSTYLVSIVCTYVYRKTRNYVLVDLFCPFTCLKDCLLPLYNILLILTL